MAQDRLDSTGLTYLWGKLKSLFALQSVIGDTPMGTTATTVTGAIAEHEQDLADLNSKLITNNVQKWSDSVTWSADNKYWNVRCKFRISDSLFLCSYFNTIFVIQVPWNASSSWTTVTPTMLMGTNQFEGIAYIVENGITRIRFTRTTGASTLTVIPLFNAENLTATRT